MPLRCVLVGSDTLLIQCAETLLARGHDLRAIVSSAPAIERWAAERKLTCHSDQGDWAEGLRAEHFDYLFAITYLRLIPESVLKLPKAGAINFHDGPLPRYAGLNAPAWGLMQRERTWGVTWHWMVAGADLGEILEQRLFDVAAQETSITLNTRCFEAGIESFAGLLTKLESGEARSLPQDLSKRTYFSRHQRPPQAAVLDWSKSAEELDALVRALDFGDRYPNPLGLPSIFSGDRVALVARASARSSPIGAQAAAPGTVLEIGSSAILVACADGALALERLLDVWGQPLGESAAKYLHLEVGSQLPRLGALEAEELSRVQALLAPSELHWAQRLATLEPVELAAVTPAPASNTSDVASAESAAARLQALPCSVPRELAQQGAFATALGVLQFLARSASASGGGLQFDVGWSDGEMRRELSVAKRWVSARVPLRVAMDPKLSLAQAREQLAAELELTRNHRGYLCDLVARQPGLRARAPLSEGRALPVAIDCVENLGQSRWLADSALVFEIDDAGALQLVFDPARLAPDAAAGLRNECAQFLAQAQQHPTALLGEIDVISPAERERVLVEWNRTQTPWPEAATLAELFCAQVQRTPQAAALVFEEEQWTYLELDRQANRLAHHLIELGAGPGKLVALHLERGLELVVAVLAVHKSGAAYVPLDPAFPRERLRYMLEDSKAEIVLTSSDLARSWSIPAPCVVELDSQASTIAQLDSAQPQVRASSSDLAYVLYTSGSTGKPKGVMVEHGNVVNFFTGMDRVLPHDPPGTWLAVTSLSFDISVLELLWTLTRGFRVVVYSDRERASSPAAGRSGAVAKHGIEFGMFYFSGDAAEKGENKYELLLEGARFADSHGFNAVWTPERHFHAFGGLYPQPAVTGAAVAAITKNVSVRAGSVVLPLHHPIRVAEAWSIVDNLSNGRVAVAFASGWMPEDFVLYPENFRGSKKIMFESIELVRRLWRGEKVAFPGALGEPVEVRTLPRPIQKELTFWITTAGNPETYEQAGRLGANILTHLLGQSIEELAPKIALYRQARAGAGFDPDTGVVTLMLHTFLGNDEQAVRQTVRGPMKQYLGTSVDLVKHYAWAFPAFKRPKEGVKIDNSILEDVTKEELDAILEFSFERYYETSGLFGTPQSVQPMIDGLHSIGVNEIACLVDFGVPTAQVIESFAALDQMRRLAQERLGGGHATCSVSPSQAAKGQTQSALDQSFAAQVKRHKVTHMQCTPSMARMLCLHEESRQALASIQHVMIGGEAFGLALARELSALVPGTLTNMYGPTETAVWSTTHRLAGHFDSIPIGRPIANTKIYVLDAHRRPVAAQVPGELFIGGAGVVRGYWNRPDLTAERFVPDPFSNEPGARMYKTGDLARWRSDGALEFLGRSDFQVKIRGYRIELEEIEAALAGLPGVRECVVVALRDSQDEVRLAAYATADQADPAAWRTALSARLPEYMVPAHFVVLERMPLTPNGKIDRKALPAPDAPSAARSVAFVAPQNSIETEIATVWKETLGLAQVGVDDNFFDLGGHSLLVVRVHRNLRERLEHPLSLTDLYRFPTIRALAAFLDSGGVDESAQRGTDRAAKRREALLGRRKKTTLS